MENQDLEKLENRFFRSHNFAILKVTPSSPIRAGLYIRVSTVDQNPQLQFDELREFCRARSWRNAAEFVDHGISGVDSARPGLRQLLQACHLRTIDAVVVWRLDRLARSLPDLVQLSKTFESLGINFVSVKNPGLDTTTPQGKLFFGISAVFAEFERDLIIERTRAGIAAAKARGKKLGRPRLKIDIEEIFKLKDFGLSTRQIAKSLDCSQRFVVLRLHDRRNRDR